MIDDSSLIHFFFFFFTSRVSLHDILFLSTSVQRKTLWHSANPTFFFTLGGNINANFRSMNLMIFDEEKTAWVHDDSRYPELSNADIVLFSIVLKRGEGGENGYDRHSKRDINTMQFLDNAAQSLQDMRCEPSASTMR